MTDCIFCKIIKGEMPCYKVYEDEDFLVFLDIMPVNKGHTLVISKQHYETIIDTPDELLEKMINIMKKVTKALKQDCDGVNIAQNNFKASGQLVPHIHFHIIPRFESDGLKSWPQGKYDENEIEQFRLKIENLLK